MKSFKIAILRPSLKNKPNNSLRSFSTQNEFSQRENFQGSFEERYSREYFTPTKPTYSSVAEDENVRIAKFRAAARDPPLTIKEVPTMDPEIDKEKARDMI